MTTTTANAADQPARVLAPRTLQTYAADWALFTDWCAATDTTRAPGRPARCRRLPDRVPGRGRDTAVPGRRHRPPPHHHHRIRAAGGVGVRAGRARPAHRRTLPAHGDG